MMSRKLPPGPAGLPLLGSVFPWLRDQPRFLLETYRRYGDVVRFEFLGYHGAILHGAEANRSILIDAVDNFQVGPVIDRARARWIVGQGIVFIDEPAHRQQRRLILPSMHRKRIEVYQQVMREVTTQLLDCWQPGVVIDIASEMDDLALIIEGRTLWWLLCTSVQKIMYICKILGKEEAKCFEQRRKMMCSCWSR